jgi:ABC-type branched-subunit amino acid transport system substrate-binding protein
VKKRLVAGLGAVALLAVGCSSSGSGGGSGKGELELFQIAPLHSQVVSATYMQSAADAAVKQINASGGVNGRKLKLTTCNDQYEAQSALRCAQQAVSDKNVIAVVGSLTGFGPQIMPLMEKAKLPVVGSDALAPIDATSPMAFLIDTGVPGPDIAMPSIAKKYLGATKVAVIQEDQAQTAANIPYFTTGAKQAGIPISKYITVPADATDYSSYVSQAEDSGAEGLMSTMQGPQDLATWKALASSRSKVKLLVSGSSVGQDQVTQAGSIAEGTYLVNGVPTPDDSTSTGAAFLSTMKKYAPANTELNGLGVRAWASVHLVAQVVGGIKGSVDRASTLSALQGVHDMSFMWIKSLSFDKAGPIPSLPRIVATTMFPSVVKNGKITPLPSFDPFAGSN